MCSVNCRHADYSYRTFIVTAVRSKSLDALTDSKQYWGHKSPLKFANWETEIQTHCQVQNCWGTYLSSCQKGVLTRPLEGAPPFQLRASSTNFYAHKGKTNILKRYKTSWTTSKCKTRVGRQKWTSKGVEKKKLQPKWDREIAPRLH